MIIRNTISTVNRYFLYFFIAISLSLVALFFALLHGVHLKTIKVPNATIKGFYLKLDKKLILDIDSVAIQSSEEKEDMSTKKSVELLQNVKLLLNYFESIDINSITYGDYEGKIHYSGKEFLFDTKDLSGVMNFDVNKKSIVIDVKSLLFREYGVNTFGIVVYRLDEDLVDFGGRFIISPNIVGSITLSSNLKSADVELITQNFTTLEPLRELIPLESDDAREWTFDRVKAKLIRLNSLKLHIANLDRPDEIGKDDISLDFDAESVSVKFQETLPVVFAKKLKGVLKNNNFLFTLDGANYQKTKLYDSSVLIGDIFSDGESKLYLDIKTHSKLDRDINNILQSYGVNLPLIQKSGETEAEFFMKMDFKEYNTDIRGSFKVKESEFLLNELPFYTKEAQIELRNSDINFTNTHFKLDDMLDLVANGHMNTNKMLLEGEADVKGFDIKTDRITVAKARAIKTPFSIDFSGDRVLLDIPKYLSSISFEDETNTITLNSLEKLNEISPLIEEYKIDGGKLTLRTPNFENYSLLGDIKTSILPFLKEGKKIEELKFEGSLSSSSLDIKDKNDNIEVRLGKQNHIYINGVDLNIEDSNQNSEESLEDFDFELFAYNSSVFFNGTKLLATRYKVTSQGGELLLHIEYNGGEFMVKKSEEKIELNGKKLVDNFINTILNRNITKGGEFYINGKSSDRGLVGTVDINQTTLTNMAAINNLLAFFDTIPSLATLKSPGFNQEGYKIEKGVINYTYNGNLISLDSIYLDGKSMDITGRGTIDTKKGTINMPLKITLMKNLSSIIDSIPVVNYIILGDDKSMNIGVEIKGELNNPTITTNTLEDVAKSPLNIIKRTLETPFRIFE